MLETMRAWSPIRFLYILVFFLFTPPLAFATTDVTSDIDTDTRWTTDGSPYVVNFDNGPFSQHFLTVAPDVTLTIDQGVVVKFASYNGITVDGTLRAEGTAENQIIFTSLQDDEVGGDTNGDGADTTPTSEQWMHLQFNTGSVGTFDYTVVRYGGAQFMPVPFTGIENSGGTLTINHTTLAHNGYDGFGQYGGQTTITNSLISDQLVGISVYGGELSVSNASIHNNEVGIDNQNPDITVDALNNWWGDASGPYDPANNVTGIGNGISGNVVYSPWLTSDHLIPDPCVEPGACVSNVLFLPGIKGSHLYRPKDDCDASLPSCKDRLWEPGLDEGLFASLLRSAGNDDVRDLFLDSNGASVREDVYVKEKDILDSIGGKDFYASFITDMDALKTGGIMADWEPIAYDWRLSLADIVEKGKKTGERISYLEATSTPYIEQELRRLASTSKTGKVTIVAHSNGGLVAKALLNKLGSETSKSLVDDIIFVGVPQSGAPRAIGSLLYGTGEGLPLESFDFLLSKSVAREFSENSPMAYHLLPSAQYFTDVNDSSHAVGEFTGASGFAEERTAYGSILNTVSELYDFLLALDGGREKPSTSETLDANVLNETLIDYARDAHSIYDAWTPPSEITLYQVAGWGVDTVAGLRFTELPLNLAGPFTATHRDMFSPTFVEDGDGVVPVPSALMTSTSSPNVKRYWVNLKNFGPQVNRKHADLLEIADIREFIRNILESTESYPSTLLNHQPSNSELNKKLVFILHSPLTLQLTDSSGNTTGLSGDDAVTENISGATYGEFGEAKYIIAPEGNYTLSMNGQTDGTFTLEMQEMTGNDTTASVIIANVPATSDTLASLTISGGIDTASALTVDEDGDGATDITITPQLGETVNYEPPAPEPAPETQASSGGGGGYSTSITVPVVIITATSTPATTTPAVQTISTSTPEFATSTPITQVKNKPPVSVVAVNNSQEAETEKKIENIAQTASVYDAVSQQSVLKKLGEMVYNGLHGLWLAIMRFF